MPSLNFLFLLLVILTVVASKDDKLGQTCKVDKDCRYRTHYCVDNKCMRIKFCQTDEMCPIDPSVFCFRSICARRKGSIKECYGDYHCSEGFECVENKCVPESSS